MDPDAYRSYRSLMRKLPPYIPVNEETSGQPGESSSQQRPADTRWTMNNPNLDEMDVGQNDASTFVGSRPEVSTAQNVTNATPWMSSTEQQPLMWSAWTDAR
jgi:hypothetical protein